MISKLRKIKNYLEVNKNFYLNSRVINRVDNKITKKVINNEKLSNDLNNLSEKGYLYFQNFFPEELNQKSFEIINQDKGLFCYDIIKIFEFVNENFYGIIKSYLGDACLINYNILHHTKNLEDISGNWHTDNLGNKINLFICLQGDGKIPTAYIPGSHKKKYQMNLFDNLRLLGIKNFEKKEKETKFCYKKNDCVMFDANGLHRGVYENDNEKARIVFQMEFLNLEKVNKLGFKDQPKLLFFKNSKPKFRKQPPDEKKLVNPNLIEKFSEFDFIKKDFFIHERDKFYYYF